MDKKERFTKAFNYLVSEGVIKRQEDLAVAMKASRSNISTALSGNEKVLTEKFLIRFCRTYPGIFSLTWLLTGEGKMLLSDKNEQEVVGIPTIDYSSIINAFIASKDGEIAAKNEVIRAKDAQIAQLQQSMQEKDQVITDLRRALTMLQYSQSDDDTLKKHVVPFGLADEKEGVRNEGF